MALLKKRGHARRIRREPKKPAPARAPVNFASADLLRSGAGVEHRHGAAVLRPARDVVTYRDRALLAVGDRAHAAGLHAARDEILTHRLGAPRAERNIVLARAALVSMAFDREG